MAVKFKDVHDLKKKIESSPLSEKELEAVSEIEQYIDNQIVDEYPKSEYNEVRVILSVPTFRYNPITRVSGENRPVRQSLMQKELEKRYRESGWTISYHLDDGLDGPNLSGADYWILKGKSMRG